MAGTHLSTFGHLLATHRPQPAAAQRHHDQSSEATADFILAAAAAAGVPLLSTKCGSASPRRAPAGTGAERIIAAGKSLGLVK